ncbi:juvenile hormone esterase isoform X2 [Bicyclus anynana]|nr:juvenile hormone esterase isoform X2 [Bicyclus anynana]XP_052741655.1 juvenile hormone esterase isoform X2 [Bicyclus anynana]XP_052741656.1 juvenile hormone esterase isoform X2 [Bicyclus anynana]
MNPIVAVTEGKLSGNVRETSNGTQYVSFKGVPYAKPPINELRFTAPEPPEPWEGVRDATKECNICAQFDRESLKVIGDEDCLYLNVYTPSLPQADASLLPVMVFSHGGGFVYGNGTDDTIHGPDYLIEKNVVVVSLNYRLGVLGFLNLDCKEAPGNMGLKDQVQALKWVQQNIKNFNGDPNNVTIFGISAGGASVEYLMLAPMAKGLFHKAIAQSGSSLLPWAQNNNIKEYATMIPVIKKKVITDNQDLLTFLKTMSIEDLISTAMMVLASEKVKGGLHFGFVPSIEKQGDWEPFFTKSTYELLAQGEFNKVPFISGFCTREGLLMLPYSELFEKIEKDKKFVDLLPFNLDDKQKIEYESKFKTVYLEGNTEYDEQDSFAIDYFTDLDFLGGVYVATSLIAKNNSPVYFYEFKYDGNLNYLKKKLKIDREGACHGDDGGYLVKSDLLKGNLSDTDKLVRDRMCQMWTNFATFGDPTPKIDNVITTTWEPIAKTGMARLVIDDKLTMNYDTDTDRTKLFKELYEKCY